MNCLIQGTEEWKELRKSKITATDARVIMGVDPWKSALELKQEKLGLKEEASPTFYMQKAMDLEEEAREVFEEMMDLIMFPVVIFHPIHDWMMASLDGMDITKTYIVEIKCPGKKDHLVAKKGKVPDKYYPQLQHQIEVAGVDFAYYFSYADSNGIIIEVPRDEEYIQELIRKENQFFNSLI